MLVQKEIVCKVGAKEISVTKKKPSTLYKNKKMPWGHVRNQQDPLKAQVCETVSLSFEKRVLGTSAQEGLPKELISWDLFHYAQLFGHSKAIASVAHGGLATASTDSTSWYCLHDAGFTSMQNARAVVSGRRPSRFQRKVWKVRQGARERAWSKAVGMKPKVQWQSQEAEDARNVEHLPRKALSHEWSQLKREAMRSTASKVCEWD